MTLETARIRLTAGAAAFGSLAAPETNEKDQTGNFAAMLMNMMEQRPAQAEQPRFKTVTQRPSPIMRREKPEPPPRPEQKNQATAEKKVQAQARKVATKAAPERPEASVEGKSKEQTDKTAENKPAVDQTETSQEASLTSLENVNLAKTTEDGYPELSEDLEKEILEILKDDETVQSFLATLQPQEAKQLLEDLVKAAVKVIQKSSADLADNDSQTTAQKIQGMVDLLKASPELSKLGLELDQKTAQKLFEKLLVKAELKANKSIEISEETTSTKESTNEQTEQPKVRQEDPLESKTRQSEASSTLNREAKVDVTSDTPESQANTNLDQATSGKRAGEESLRARFENRQGDDAPAVPTKPAAQAAFTSGSTRGAEASVAAPTQVLKEYAQFESKLVASMEGSQTEEVALKVTGPRKGFSQQQSDNGNQGSAAFSRGLKAEMHAGKAPSSEGLRNTVFNQLIEKAMLNKGPEAVKTLTIQLKPEFLGKVDMELKTKDGVVTARLMAENPVVRDTIESLIPQIREHLAEQGINLQQFTVDVYSQQSRRDQMGNGSGKNSGGSSSSRETGLRGAHQGSEAESSEKPLTNANGMIDITV